MQLCMPPCSILRERPPTITLRDTAVCSRSPTASFTAFSAIQRQRERHQHVFPSFHQRNGIHLPPRIARSIRPNSFGFRRAGLFSQPHKFRPLQSDGTELTPLYSTMPQLTSLFEAADTQLYGHDGATIYRIGKDGSGLVTLTNILNATQRGLMTLADGRNGRLYGSLDNFPNGQVFISLSYDGGPACRRSGASRREVLIRASPSWRMAAMGISMASSKRARSGCSKTRAGGQQRRPQLRNQSPSGIRGLHYAGQRWSAVRQRAFWCPKGGGHIYSTGLDGTGPDTASHLALSRAPSSNRNSLSAAMDGGTARPLWAEPAIAAWSSGSARTAKVHGGARICLAQ